MSMTDLLPKSDAYSEDIVGTIAQLRDTRAIMRRWTDAQWDAWAEEQYRMILRLIDYMAKNWPGPRHEPWAAETLRTCPRQAAAQAREQELQSRTEVINRLTVRKNLGYTTIA